LNALDLIGNRPYKVEREGQYILQCPAHDDKTASLAIKQDGDRVLVHCFAGCLWSDCVEALGIERGAFSNRGTSPPPEAPKVSLPPLYLDVIEPLPKVAREWLTKHRCISEKVQKWARLGCARDRVAIPVWDKDGNIVDIRLWLRPEKRTNGQSKIFSWERGRGGSRLYPIDGNGPEEVVLCAGELDALALMSLNIPALTTTGSESSFPRRIAQEMKDLGIKRVRVLLDADETGIKGTQLRIERLREQGIEATGIFWQNRLKGWDVTDEIREYGNVNNIL
jgi:hypothetical protein